jgi:hypothetical protein
VKEAMRKLGNQLRPKLPLPAQLTHGTVTAVDTGTDTISVDLGDAANPTTNVPVLPGYYPTVGDYILLHKMGPALVAAGKAGPVVAGSSTPPVMWHLTATSPVSGIAGTSVTLLIDTGGRTYLANHYYEIWFAWYGVAGSVVLDQFDIKVSEPSVAVRQSRRLTIHSTARVFEGGTMVYPFQQGGSDTSRTFKAEAIRVGGTGTMTIEATSEGVMRLYMKDLGL